MIREFGTDRFIIRTISIDDVSSIFECWPQEKEVSRYMTVDTASKKAETKQFIERHLQGWSNNSYTWVIEMKGTQEIIGRFAVRRNQHKVDSSYLLARKFWRNGYMVEVIKAFILGAF